MMCNFKIEHIKDVSKEDLENAEKYIQMPLPESYKNYLLEIGRFRVVYDDKDIYHHYEILHPKQSTAIIQSEIDNFEETVFGDSEEEIKAAHKEFELRKRLYPFQYCSTYVHDFWCFYLDSRKNEEYLIVDIYHDDCELEHFLEPGKIYPDSINNSYNEYGDYDVYSFYSFMKERFKKITESFFEEITEGIFEDETK